MHDPFISPRLVVCAIKLVLPLVIEIPVKSRKVRDHVYGGLGPVSIFRFDFRTVVTFLFLSKQCKQHVHV